MTETEQTQTALKDIDFDSLRRLIVSAQGGDPDAQQTLNAFLRFNNTVERTNLPDRKMVQAVSYLGYAGKTFFPEREDDPFSKANEEITTAFMALRGGKSQQFVDLMRQTPSLADLQTGNTENRSLLDKALGRNKQ